MKLRDLIHFGPIYDGLQRRPATAIPGWNDHSAKFNELLANRSGAVLDVGSWLGRSAVMLANAAPHAEIIAIDTFTGALEMWTNPGDPERYGALKIRHGFPTLYHDWRQNIFNHRKENQVTPFPVPSATAFRFIEKSRLPVSCVYVDASHEYEDVKADIIAALRLDPDVIMGDDWQPGWPGVVRAVTELVPDFKVDHNGLWWRVFR